MNNTQKYFSLLRPFDLDEAKAGALVCWHDGDVVVKSILDADDFRAIGRGIDGNVCMWAIENLRMAPLFWVEGKPVYKGDRLYSIDKWVTASGTIDHVGWTTCEDGYHRDTTRMTWSPPFITQTGWIAIKHQRSAPDYKAWCSHVLATRQQAEAHYGPEPCSVVSVTWQAPHEQ